MAFVMKRLTWPRMWHCCGEEEDARNGGVCSDEGDVYNCGVCNDEGDVYNCGVSSEAVSVSGGDFWETCGGVVVSIGTLW